LAVAKHISRVEQLPFTSDHQSANINFLQVNHPLLWRSATLASHLISW